MRQPHRRSPSIERTLTMHLKPKVVAAGCAALLLLAACGNSASNNAANSDRRCRRRRRQLRRAGGGRHQPRRRSPQPSGASTAGWWPDQEPGHRRPDHQCPDGQQPADDRSAKPDRGELHGPNRHHGQLHGAAGERHAEQGGAGIQEPGGSVRRHDPVELRDPDLRQERLADSLVGLRQERPVVQPGRHLPGADRFAEL